MNKNTNYQLNVCHLFKNLDFENSDKIFSIAQQVSQIIKIISQRQFNSVKMATVLDINHHYTKYWMSRMGYAHVTAIKRKSHE